MSEHTNFDTYPPMPPPTEVMPGTEQNIQTHIGNLTRSQFLVYGGLALFGTALTGVKFANEVMMEAWPYDPKGLQLDVLPYEHTPESRYEGFVCAAGFGGMHGDLIGPTLQKYGKIQPYTPVSSFVYPNQGFELNEVSSKIRRYVRNEEVRSLSLLGISMGGPTLLAASRDVGVPLRRIILGCSPERIRDAEEGELGAIIARLNWDNQPLEKFIGTYLNDIRDEGWSKFDEKGIVNTLKRVYQQTERGASPKLLGKQLQILANFDFMSDWKSYQDIIIPGFTEVLFCAPKDLLSDNTVNDSQAYLHWQEFFAQFGVDMHYRGVPEPGHALIKPIILASGPWNARYSAIRPAFK